MDFRFGFGVGESGGLIKDEYWGVDQQGTGDGDALCLATGKPLVGAVDGVKTVGKSLNHIKNVGAACGLADFFIAGTGLAQSNVVAQGNAQQLRILQHEGNVLV